MVHNARQTAASEVGRPHQVLIAECDHRKTIKYMSPKRSEAERELLFAKYEYTLGKEAGLQEMGKTASFGDCFRETDLRRTFLRILPGEDFVDDGQFDRWTPGDLLVSPKACAL